jgi:hypothetical protein
MELVGMPVNKRTITATGSELHKIKNSHRTQLEGHNNPIIGEYEKYLRLEAALVANSKLKVKRKTADDFQDVYFNPNSHKQLAGLLYDHLELPVFNYTDKGAPSTDGKTIDALIAYMEQQ